MKLDKLHVHELGAGFESERHAVSRVLPGIGSNGPSFADAAGGDDDGLGFEDDEAAVFAPISESAGDATAVDEKARDGALHVTVETKMHTAILQSANHLEAGAIANVAEASVGVAAESALENRAVIRAIEKRAPLFEFADAVGRFLGVELSHAPVVEKLSAAHGVAEVRLPAVGGIHVGHGGGDSALGHDRVSFSEKGFANHTYRGALRERFNGCAQPGAAGANDENVVLAKLVASGHRSLRSWKAPQATMRT